jgi:glucosamine--fructose-6-phosphate aminotransferase (isomerizing)
MACGYWNGGYDSAGIAVIDGDGTLQVAKKAGRIENLEKELADVR